MEIVNLLEFLNSVDYLYAESYATDNLTSINFLELLSNDKQFTQNIDLGQVFISHKTSDSYVVIDGLSRLTSLSLLLHAICECYKKTTTKNDKAIQTIRNKYLIKDNKTKLRLPDKFQEIYEKIIYGERLSGKEKDSILFRILHSYWTTIKEQQFIASDIFKMLQKISIYLVDVEGLKHRDLYYSINKNLRKLDQLSLIHSYINDLDLEEDWKRLKKIHKTNNDLNLFFKDFFTTKFNFENYDVNNLYEYFANYYITMLKYLDVNAISNKMLNSAKLYNDIINVNFDNIEIKNAIIQIKMHSGEDTYAYILSVYEDFSDNNLSETTFLEILHTIDEYLKNRLKTPNNVSFNELIHYLNAFITCK